MKNLEKLFPTGGAWLAKEATSRAVSDWPERSLLVIKLDLSSGVAVGSHVELTGGTSRLQILAVRDRSASTLHDVVIRIDIPRVVALDEIAADKYSIYQIRFAIPRGTCLEESSVSPLFHGYVGITKRHPLARYREHLRKAKTNTGYALHTVWHGLIKAKVPFYPVLQVVGFAKDLKSAYAAEEALVAEHTLVPLGLNAIPGGEAGIRELHRLSVLRPDKRLPGVEARDAALSRAEHLRDIAAHYRRGHFREYKAGKLAFVKACWVNLKAAA